MNWKKIAAAIALCSAASPAGAVGGITDVTVYDRAENRTLPVYLHEGRYYVVGSPGHSYQIRVRNRTGADILTVVSVDGVNAVSGETADWSQTGYVLGRHQGYDIKGWRKSEQRIAAFFFTEHQNSYAARTGRPDNVGVIGVAVFRKKAEPEARIEPYRPRRDAPASGPREDSSYSAFDDALAGAGSSHSAESAPPPSGRGQGDSDSASASSAPSRSTLRESESGARSFRHAPSQQAPQKSSSLGTGHGRSETSHVTYTNFERATDHPEEAIAIHYNTYSNLVAMGVIRAPRIALPTPFRGQFVPDPR